MDRLPFTTLCYIEQEGAYLMLHRVKKAHDENQERNLPHI